MKRDNNKVVFLRLDEETKKQLIELARLNDRSNNAEVRQLIHAEHLRHQLADEMYQVPPERIDGK